MATLHVRSVPEELYEGIRSLASEWKRSLSAQVIMMLENSLREERRRPTFSEVLERIRRRRLKHPPKKGDPDSLSLLREDRAR